MIGLVGNPLYLVLILFGKKLFVNRFRVRFRVIFPHGYGAFFHISFIGISFGVDFSAYSFYHALA